MSDVALNLAAFAKDDPVLRIEPHHFHLRAQCRAGRGENFLKHARIKKEGRSEIELEAVRLNRRRASADDGRRSSIFTFTPEEASRMAEARPPGPAPIMMTSLFIGCIAAAERSEFCLHAARAKSAPAAYRLESQERGRKSQTNPDLVRFLGQNTIAAVPITTAPPARRSRPLLSMLKREMI